MNEININLKENSYDVIVGENIFENIFTEIENRNLYKNILLVIDEKVYSIYKNKIDELASSYKHKINSILLKADENKKDFDSLFKIYNALLENNYGRDTTIVAIGGGIIGDIAGFASASYMRGVQYVQVPTTILAAVDSSVGGKTAVNFASTKNSIGAFYQPKLVLADANFFKSLEKEEILCGIGEVIKYAFLIGGEFYSFIDENLQKLIETDKKIIEQTIIDSVEFKGAVVAKDEKEGGLRKVLNLGHTFGHAIEVEQKHKIKHGQAVIVGIACAVFLSHKLTLLNKSHFEKLISFLKKFTQFISIDSFNLSDIYSIMLRDKKNKDGKIRFVLLADGHSAILDVEAGENEVLSALEDGLNLFKS